MPESDIDKQLREKDQEMLILDAKLRHQLIQHGNILARKHGYPHLDGMNALCRYFADKYGWLPEQTRKLSTGDLSLLLEDAE